jgi:hypothetical protein
MARPQAWAFGNESPVIAVCDSGSRARQPKPARWPKLTPGGHGTYVALVVASVRMDLRSASEPKRDVRCPLPNNVVFGPCGHSKLGCASCSKFSVRVDRRIYAFEANRLLSFGVTAPIANAFTEQLTLLRRFGRKDNRLFPENHAESVMRRMRHSSIRRTYRDRNARFERLSIAEWRFQPDHAHQLQ